MKHGQIIFIGALLFVDIAQARYKQCTNEQRKEIYLEATTESTEFSKNAETAQLSKIVGPSLIEELFGSRCIYLGQNKKSSTRTSKFIVILNDGASYFVTRGFDEEAGYANSFDISIIGEP